MSSPLGPREDIDSRSGDGLLRFWDLASGRLLWALQAHTSPVIGVHLEGGDIVTRALTGELSRWTLPSPEQVIRECGEHELCGYHAAMKKTHGKLVLRREIVRVLANLDLARAIGGLDSGDVQCRAVADTGAKACDTFALVIATAACR
jgi:WD40 repeat protein